MKRDMDVIRRILMRVEQAEEPTESLSECPADVFAYHAMLLFDGRLAEGDFAKGPNLLPVNAVIFHLTWKGHEFLDSARSETIWNTAKQKVLKPGASWSFSL